MPELPEVETVVGGLKQAVLDQKIAKVHFNRSDLRWKIPIPVVRKVLEGQQVTAVLRRSKYIVFETNVGFCLSHLGMTGNFLLLDGIEAKHKHTHFVIEIEGRHRHLHYIDPRRFGVLTAGLGPDWKRHALIEKLGPEPLEQRSLAKYLLETATNRKVPVKSFLMNAQVIVGIGNIYACEILFKSHIHPLRPACDLNNQDWDKIVRFTRKVLRKAIATGGSSIRDFQLVDGTPGYFSIDFDVYGRSGEPCKVCKSPIQIEKLSGRSTFFCAFCQK